MGNKLARTTQVSASEYYLHDLPSSCNLVLKEVLGGGRFLKSVQCLHDEGLLLVKVYFKRGEIPDLKEHERRLYKLREKLMKIEHSHVWPFQYWLETDKAAYLLRQYFFSNLHDRISTRPFLSMIENKWLAFQLLLALKQCHERGVCHGDIKCENVLVTSWNWLYLADFASFKPTYLPVDNPADFSFFFDTGGRRRCYLAPERFYEPVGDTNISTDAALRPSMDIFSLGCVIAELFLEGQALFDLSQLLAYRRGQYDPCPSLQKVSDVGMREMILHMIQLDPDSRFSSEQYMQCWAPSHFPTYFSPLLHGFFSCLLPLDTDTRVAVTSSAFSEIRKQMINSSMAEEEHNSHAVSDMISSQGSFKGEHKQSNALQTDTSQIIEEGDKVDDSGTNIRYARSQSLPNASYQGLISDINALLRGGGDSVTQPAPSVMGDPFLHPPSDYKKGINDKFFRRSNSSILLSPTSEIKRLIEKSPSLVGRDVGMDRILFSSNLSPIIEGQGSNMNARFMRRLKAAAVAMAQADIGENIIVPERKYGMESVSFQYFVNAPGSSLLCTEAWSDEVSKTISCEGMVLIASLLCASVRNVKLPQARRGAVQLLHDSSLYIDDDARLQHVLPYVATLLSDPAAIVRCAALQTVCDVLSLVQSFPPSDSKIFPEYILPLFSMLPDDPEESVRICYANNMHKIVETACRFHLCSQNMTELSVLDKSAYALKGPSVKTFAVPSLQQQNGKYDTDLAYLRESVARIIQELVMGPKQTPNIRRALLQHVGKLCQLFGQKQSNDFLLPVLPAFLNDRDEQLRAVFFEQIVHVCLFVGQTSVEAYLLPYIEQALSDVEETVIVNALECLATFCVNKLVRKRVLIGVVEHAAPLLCHPSQWVRRSAITFVASASASLELSDSHAFLSPILTPFLRREPVSLCSESALLTCLKPPMSREAFNRVLSDVMLSQTASETINGKQLNQLSKKQMSSLPHSPDSIQNRAALERRRLESGSSITTVIDEGKNRKSSPGKLPLLSDPVLQSEIQHSNTIELDDGEKMKAMEGYIRNLSSTMQNRMHNWEIENSEKLQSSVIRVSTSVGAGSYSNYDGSSEGIPLYSVPLNENKSEFQGMPSFNEEWNRILRVRQSASPFHMAALSGSPTGPVVSSQWVAGHSSMPVGVESMQRSRMMGSFSPKLMSGSVYGGSMACPRRVYEVIRDVNGRGGELGYMHSGFSNAASRVKDLSGPEFEVHGFVSAVEPGMAGPSLSDATTGLSCSGTALPDSRWRPRGVLIAHMQEHQRAVNEVTVSHDNIFFVSASDDGSVKIWDCRRLETNISFRSRLTYSLHNGRALHVSMLGTGAQVAVASSSGTIHVFCVDYVARLGGSVEKYSGIIDVKKLESQEGAVLSLQNFSLDGPPMLLYTTQRNGIHLWDLRTQSDVWMLMAKPVQGYISATALDSCSNWLVTATSRGVLTLWDLRFQIPVNSWLHPLNCPVESMRPLLQNSDLASASNLRPYVYVAAGRDEVALWNAEDGTCHQVLRFSSDGANSDLSEIPNALAQRSKSTVIVDSKRKDGLKAIDYRLDELNEPPPRIPGIRSLLPLPGGAAILTGGTDYKIRFWDQLRPECSYCVCGPSIKGSSAMDTCKYDVRVVNGVQIIQELCSPQSNKITPKACLGAAATDTVGCHRDCVLSLARIQTNQCLLVSSCRDGAIKVWK